MISADPAVVLFSSSHGAFDRQVVMEETNRGRVIVFPRTERGHSRQISGSQAVKGGSRRPFVVNSCFRDRFDAEPAFHLQRQSLDPSPETARWTPIVPASDRPDPEFLRPGQARRRLGRGRQRAPGAVPGLPETGRRDVGRQLPRAASATLRSPRASRPSSKPHDPAATQSLDGTTPRHRLRPARFRRAWPTTPITRSSASSAGAAWAWSTWPTTS